MTNAETETETKTETTDRDRITARIVCEVRQACLDLITDDGEVEPDDEPYESDERMAAHLLVRIIVTGLNEGRLNLRTWWTP